MLQWLDNRVPCRKGAGLNSGCSVVVVLVMVLVNGLELVGGGTGVGARTVPARVYLGCTVSWCGVVFCFVWFCVCVVVLVVGGVLVVRFRDVG